MTTPCLRSTFTSFALFHRHVLLFIKHHPTHFQTLRFAGRFRISRCRSLNGCTAVDWNAGPLLLLEHAFMANPSLHALLPTCEKDTNKRLSLIASCEYRHAWCCTWSQKTIVAEIAHSRGCSGRAPGIVSDQPPEPCPRLPDGLSHPVS